MTMIRCCDDDDAMVRLCDGDGVMTMVRWLWGNIFYRTIVIASSHHGAIDFFADKLFPRIWSQMWVFFISETLIFLAYCCKIIKNVSNDFFCLEINLKKNCLLNTVTHTIERGYFLHYRVVMFQWFCSSCIYLRIWQTFKWQFGAMTRWCDDDKSMVRWCVGDGVRTTVWWYDDNDAMLYYTIVIES